MQCALRGAVDIVATPPAIACHRTDDDDESGSLRLELMRRNREQRDRAGKILMDGRERLARIDLRFVLVAQGTEAQHDAIETAELVGRARDELRVRREIGSIEGSR